MTGSLIHVGGDRYKVRVYAGLDPTGKQRIRSKTFHAPSQQAANRAASKVTADLLASIEEDRAKSDTIAGVATEWVKLKAARGRSPSTIVNYERHVDRIITRFGKVHVADLTGRMIDHWYAELSRKGMSDANILAHHATLRGVLRQAERWDMVAKVATRACTPPEKRRPSIILPTSSAVGVTIRSATGDIAVALHLAASTGARRGELVGLQWADLDGSTLHVRRSILKLKGGAWIVKLTKGKRERRVRLDPRTIAVLEAHRLSVEARAKVLDCETPWILPNFHSDTSGRSPRPPGWLSAEWAKLRKRHGLATTRLHDLRHWHASVLIKAGVPIVEISDRIGHAQTSTTWDIYGHLLPDDAGRSAGAIGAEMALETGP
jgi:integrase